MQSSDTQSLSQLMDGEWQDLDPSRCAAEVCRNPELQAKWARYHLIRDALHNESVTLDSDLAARVRSAVADEPAYSNVATLETAGAQPNVHSEMSNTVIADSSAAAAEFDAQPLQATGTDGPMVVVGAGATSMRSGWGRGLAGFAMVASTALVTVVGLNVWQGSLAPSSAANVTVAEAGLISADTVEAVAGVSDSGLSDTSGSAPALELVANRGTHWVTSEPERQADIEKRLNMFLSQHIENSPTADRTGMLPYSRLVGYDELSD